MKQRNGRRAWRWLTGPALVEGAPAAKPVLLLALGLSLASPAAADEMPAGTEPPTQRVVLELTGMR
jgi:hypothetical protein